MADTRVEAWRRYGVLIEHDSDGSYRWAESSDGHNETGAFSPPFSTLDSCIGDLEWCYGPLPQGV